MSNNKRMAAAVPVTIGLGGLCTPLAVVLVVLKVTGLINISWLWALCPLWLGLATFLVVFAVFLAIAVVCVVVGVLLAGLAFFVERL